MEAPDAVKPWFVYGLVWHGEGRAGTYIGATVDLARRLRQHNGELAGGARRTARKRQKAGQWRMVISAGPFGGERIALQSEWAWKRACRKFVAEPFGLPRLRAALHSVLTARSATLRAEPWPPGGVAHLIRLHSYQ